MSLRPPVIDLGLVEFVLQRLQLRGIGGLRNRLGRESHLLCQSDESWMRPKFVERGPGDRAHDPKRTVFVTALEKIQRALVLAQQDVEWRDSVRREHCFQVQIGRRL